MRKSIYNILHPIKYNHIYDRDVMTKKTASTVDYGFEKQIFINVYFRETLPDEPLGEVIDHHIINDLIGQMYSCVHNNIALKAIDQPKSNVFSFVSSMAGYYCLGDKPCASLTLGVPEGYDPYNFWEWVDCVLRQSPWFKQSSLLEVFENNGLRTPLHTENERMEQLRSCDMNGVFIDGHPDDETDCT